MHRLIVVVLVGLVSGCASSGGGLGLTGQDDAPDPYYKEYRELMTGEHHRDFPVPVDAQASAITIGVTLKTRAQGLPLPDPAPATMSVTLLSPEGSILDKADLNVQHPNATLLAEDLTPGRYLTRVDGFGASQDLDGKPVGAEYLLSVEILYG